MAKDFRDLIGSWPRENGRTSIGTFAVDAGVPYLNAQMMRHRNSVPSDYWPQLVEAARRRGLEGVTLELLAQLQVKKRAQRKRVRVRVRPSVQVAA